MGDSGEARTVLFEPYERREDDEEEDDVETVELVEDGKNLDDKSRVVLSETDGRPKYDDEEEEVETGEPRGNWLRLVGKMSGFRSGGSFPGLLWPPRESLSFAEEPPRAPRSFSRWCRISI